jgi:tellurite resistance protein TerC
VEIPIWVWIATIGGFAAMVVLDLVIADRRPHVVGTREATKWVLFYVSLAVTFGIVLGIVAGWQFGGEFFAGYITELSLSVDNLFVFVVIIAAFAVPPEYQHRVLMIGIVLALLLRGILIVVGAAAIEAFSGVFYIFGAFLLFTALQLLRHSNDTPEPGKNAVLRWAERRLPTTSEYHGTKLFILENGKRLATPMLLVIIAIGTTDILFALDSIPAIFGLTEEPYIVLTANAFALLGLRQLYFLLNGLLDRLVYLSIGLAAILGFIGVKLILHALHESTGTTPEVSLPVSLGVIIGILVVTTVASLLKVRRDPSAVETIGMAADAERDAVELAGEELERVRALEQARRDRSDGGAGPGDDRR